METDYISPRESNPGFSRTVLILDTKTGRSIQAGEIPGPAQVTATAVQTPWCIVIPSGEIKPGVRTTATRMAGFR